MEEQRGSYKTGTGIWSGSDGLRDSPENEKLRKRERESANDRLESKLKSRTRC